MTDESLTPNFITVSLDRIVTPPVLKVDDTGGNKVPRKPDKQEIQWKLDHTLKGGAFVPMSDCRPGFEWLSWPLAADGVFGEANIAPSGDSLTITDLHTSETSDGTWFYRLRVRHEGTIYQTILKVEHPEDLGEGECPDAYARVMLNDNPVIINR